MMTLWNIMHEQVLEEHFDHDNGTDPYNLPSKPEVTFFILTCDSGYAP